MKRITLILALALFASTSVFAQKGKIAMANSYFTSGSLTEAKRLIDEVAAAKGGEGYDKFYFLYAQIYQAMLEDKRYNKSLKPGDIDKIWEAYQQVEKLDTKGKYTKKLGVQYKNLQLDYKNYGVKLYDSKDYKGAQAAFERVLAMYDNPRLKEVNKGQTILDTTVIFHAGMCAQQAKNYQDAEKYYKQLVEIGNYREKDVYEMLISVLRALDKGPEAIELIKKGVSKFEDNNYLLVEMINYYLDSKDPMEAIPYLDAAIKKNPSNIPFIRAKANLLEKTGELKTAVELYNQVLQIDPNDFFAIYELGVITLDSVNELQTKVQKIDDFKKYDAAMKDVYKEYERVLGYFSKANAVNPTDQNTINTLKELYYKLRNYDDKYEKLYEAIKSKAK